MDHIGHGVAEGRTQVSNFHFRETNRSIDTNDAKPRQDTVNTVKATQTIRAANTGSCSLPVSSLLLWLTSVNDCWECPLVLYLHWLMARTSLKMSERLFVEKHWDDKKGVYFYSFIVKNCKRRHKHRAVSRIPVCSSQDSMLPNTAQSFSLPALWSQSHMAFCIKSGISKNLSWS